MIKQFKPIDSENSYYFELLAESEGYKVIAGIDEAGRGALAGPVVAATVILGRGFTLRGIDDSKKLSVKKRELLFDQIIKKSLASGYAMASPSEIDSVNILQATLLAMKRSTARLTVEPDILLVDGITPIKFGKPEWLIIKGDNSSISIAAASIIAKVSRDRYMRSIAKEYPEYKFESNKGYPTASHIASIEKYGLSPLHRASFRIRSINR